MASEGSPAVITYIDEAEVLPADLWAALEAFMDSGAGAMVIKIAAPNVESEEGG